LKGQRTRPSLRTKKVICGIGQKRGAEEPAKEPERKKPRCGPQPIITMPLNVEQGKHRVRVLLNTGCSVPLVNKETAWRLQIPMLKHDSTICIENYTGQQVEEAGIFYTKPLLLQHWRHYSQEIFEVTPMEREVDIFLPYWWIANHPMQGIWESEEIRFNSPGCQETCTRYEQGEFSYTWDESVTHNPNARVPYKPG